MKKIAVLCCLLVTLGASNALASMSGTLTCYNAVDGDGDLLPGMVGINAISSDLTWTVDQLEGGLWAYTYTLSPIKNDKNSGAGSIIIEFGDIPTTMQDISYDFNGMWVPYMNTATTDGVVKTIDKRDENTDDGWSYHSWLPDGTVTDVATTFQGMEWLLGDGTNYYTYGSNTDMGGMTLSFTTDLAPTWGNVYFDGFNETTNNGYGCLRNTNYDLDPTTPFVYDEALVYATSEFLGWVATPGAAAVPIPASLLLFGSGLGGLLIFKRKSQAC